jgi:hypothetical protein
MAKEVYAEVNRLYEQANPNRPKPTSRQPNGGGPSSTGVVAPANSLQEAIHAAIVKGRSGL